MEKVPVLELFLELLLFIFFPNSFSELLPRFSALKMLTSPTPECLATLSPC